MSLGMIVRADFGRGLANQTYSFWKNLRPDVTVVVDISRLDPGNKWPQTLDAYPGAIRTTWGGYTAPFDNPEAFKALQSCDMIWTAETHYDERLQDHPSIIHVNPEFWRNQKATQYWYPTPWRTEFLPPGPVIPTPVEDADIVAEVPGPGKLLHIGGHRTWGDRNGSNIVHGILQQVTYPWRITSQDGHKLHPRVLRYTEVMGYVDDRWEFYDDCAVLVSPRRFGGQSLPVNEAMARGLAVVMTDCEPNPRTWPIVPIPSRPQSRVKTPAGVLQMHAMVPGPLQEMLRVLMEDPELLERWQARSLEWARANAWSTWKPKMQELIDAG